MDKQLERSAEILRAFGDAHRLEILRLLGDGEKCASDILAALEISQSTLSHHMKTLATSGVVKARKDGKWTYYSVNAQGAQLARKALDTALGEAFAASEAAPAKAAERAPAKKPAAEKPKKAEKKPAAKSGSQFEPWL